MTRPDPIRNVKLTIEYDGTDHAGWQVQANTRTVQEAIEGVLKQILQEKVRLVSSGRTDSGVHAKAQVANFKTSSKLAAKTIHRAVNSLLPLEIVVTDAQDVVLNFHARFDAKSKVYRYTILNRSVPSPFVRRYAHFVPHPLNVEAMEKAAAHLLGKRDFKSFQASDKRVRSSVRTVKKLSVKRERDFIYIDIEADGFLYNMVRNIVGTLIEVGRGKIKPGDVNKILRSKDRRRAGPTAPARGLCLMKVKY